MPFWAPFVIFSLSFSATDPKEGWLSEPILSSEEVRQEMGEFIKRRIPPLLLPDTKAGWQRQSEELRQRILDEVVFRGVPKEWKQQQSEVVWGDTLQTGKGYQIRKLRYEALPGLWIPALLYEPTDIREKIPAILNVNGHVGPKGKAIEYEQIRCINLAKRGILALHPEWLVFGELEGVDYKHNRLAYLDLCGISGLSVFYLAMRGGLDVLENYPTADRQRLAMTGLSGGGWQTIILSALDTRISLAVPTAGYIDLHNRVAHRSDIGDLEQNPTDLVSIADYPQLTAMLAPRPALLIYNERDDCCFVAERAQPAVFNPIIPFYQLFDREGHFEYHENTHPGTHNYDQDNREQFYRFVHQHFSPSIESSDAEIPSDDELFNPDELKVGLPEGNANFFTLAHEQLQSLPKQEEPLTLDDARNRLREVLRLKPMKAKAHLLRRKLVAYGKSKERLEATWYRLAIGEEWTVPAVVASKGTPKATVIALADRGRTEIGEWIEEQVEDGLRVIAIDPLFMGESIPQGIPPGQSAMMIATAGERSLGIQVGQLGAIIEWACEKYETPQVSLYSKGWTAGVVSIAAAGLNHKRIDHVVATDALASLKRLIEDHLDYEQYPTLFCFGLLEQFDVDELIALCPAQKVMLTSDR